MSGSERNRRNERSGRTAPTPLYGEVQSTQQLTPSMIRVVLGGGNLDRFQPTPFTDQYINASFVPEGAPYSVPFTPEDIEDVGSEHRPKPRRYTVRSWDQQNQLLTVDFVSHGDVGFAGRWAANAKPGDRLQFRGPSGGYAPDPDAAWHLLIGDESAIPAIAASVEQLPKDADCVVMVVVDSAEHELPLNGPANLGVHWLHRRTAPDADTLLVDAVKELTFLPGPASVFVHGEAAETRSVRQHLLTEREIDVETASISPYWRRDHTDEQWRAVKAQWLTEQTAGT